MSLSLKTFLIPLLILGLAAATGVGCSDDLMETDASGPAPPPPPRPQPTPAEPLPEVPGWKGSAFCESCHPTHYNQWKGSMHAHSLTSPVVLAQINQVFAADLIKRDSPDPQWFCTNCHSPISTLYGQDGRLPFKSLQPDRVTDEALREGIGCVACHTYAGNPEDSRASISDIQDDFVPGTTYFGPIADPVTSPFHQATPIPLYESGTEELCLNCHNVKNDRNGDSKFELGVDLFLQTTFDEYKQDYRVNGGESSCVECHMAAKDGPAAPGYPGAPVRTVHDHWFTGVDFPLDEVAQGNDPQRAARRRLLQDSLSASQGSAASMAVPSVAFNGTLLTFSVKITNTNSGHNLPTGFAFLRQMFLEVVVKDAAGNTLAQSGALEDPASDLCDADTLADALGPFVQGCASNMADPQLVNFQTQLVDFVALVNGVLVKDPMEGHETALQFQTGGAVARTRPIDKQSLAPLRPFEGRTFGYTFALPQQTAPISIAVALKFRNLPPYFLRKLAAAEPADAPSGLADLVTTKAFQVVTMTSQLITQAPQ